MPTYTVTARVVTTAELAAIRADMRAIERDLQDPTFTGAGRVAAMRVLASKAAVVGVSMGLL